MPYSSQTDIDRFVRMCSEEATAAQRPLFVLDLDGNALLGYNLVAGAQLDVPAKDAPRRNIPQDANLEELLNKGIIEPALFAEKPMDARLPAALVSRLNRGGAFEVAVLTSRSEEDALQVLQDSGVKQPGHVTMVADSGAVLRLRGQRHAVREPSEEERSVLYGLEAQLPELERVVNERLASFGLSTDKRPPLVVERKGIATNLHFRSILRHYAMEESSPLAQTLSEALQEAMQTYIARMTQSSEHAPGFKLLHGPATLELKLADIDKGDGLRALASAAMREESTPSAIIFSGDDVYNRAKNGLASPGTDYFAFAALADIQSETGIPAYAIHVLHPQNGKLSGREPNAQKERRQMMDGYDELPRAALTLPTPVELNALVEKTLQRCEARFAKQHMRKQSSSAESAHQIRSR